MVGGRSSRVRPAPNTKEVRERVGLVTGGQTDDLLVSAALINQLMISQRVASSLQTSEFCYN